MAEYINRKSVKSEARSLLKTADVSPKKFFALYLGITAILNVICTAVTGSTDMVSLLSSPLILFVTILTNLVSLILGIGCYLYCFGIRAGERMEYLTLFDGFSFVGRVVLLYLLEALYLFCWFFPALAALGLGTVALFSGDSTLSGAIMWLPLSLPLMIPGIIALYRYRFAVLNLCENPAMSPLAAIRMSKFQTRGYKGQLFLLDLSFLGWTVLAALPDLVINFYYYYLAAVNPTSTETFPISVLAQALLSGVFLVAAGIFYLPLLRSSEIRYFEVAQQSSGLRPDALPPASRDSDDDTQS